MARAAMCELQDLGWPVVEMPGGERESEYSMTQAVSAESLAGMDALVVPVLSSTDMDMQQVMVRVMELTQALASIAQARPEWSFRVIIVTSGSEGPCIMRGISEDEGRSMGCGAVWGMMRTARMELSSRVKITCMDTDRAGTWIEDGAGFAAQLQIELSQDNSSLDWEVAYRTGLRYCRRLEPSAQHLIRAKGRTVK